MLALQASAGNRAVAAALGGTLMVQRKLNPPDAAYRPGRVPDAERASVRALLANNAFSTGDIKRACSHPDHRRDLQDRHAQVLAVEQRFESSNMSANKRRLLRVELEHVYDALLDAAARHRDDAEEALRGAVESRVDLIHADGGPKRLFKAPTGVWMTKFRPAIGASVLGDRLGSIVTVEQFQDLVFARYNAKFAGPAPVVSALSGADQAALRAEQEAVQKQLGLWRTKRYDGQGCNANGTWGTCATGSVTFNPSNLNQRVWVELQRWWRNKENTYVTRSDTTSWSLKKYRPLAEDKALSQTFNYHVNVH
ncbi:hypothetical protein [Nocardioides sp. SYSU DS0651]|uniref:hypothetical protein n=1 Tax=Nocardioides sp. SYSU DS0651 TaxID=3415955 RepID=UPI003F4C6F26